MIRQRRRLRRSSSPLDTWQGRRLLITFNFLSQTYFLVPFASDSLSPEGEAESWAKDSECLE